MRSSVPLFALAPAVAGVAGVTVAVAPPAALAPLLAVGAGAVGTMLGIATIGARRLSLALWAMAIVLAPLNAVRVADWLTLGDVFFVAAIATSLLVPTVGTPVPPALVRVLVGLGLIGAAGILAAVASSDVLGGVTALARFIVVAAALPAFLVRLRPSEGEVRVLVAACVAGGLVNVAGAIGQEVAGDGRPMGFATHFNHLGLACTLALGAAIGLASQPGAGRRIGVLAMPLLVAGIALSGSRAALLGSLAAVAVWILLARRTRLTALIVVVGCASVALLLLGVVEVPPESAIGRILALDAREVDGSNAARLILLQDALAMVRENPIAGSGFEHVRDAHNIYLQTLVAGGVLALVGLLVAIQAVLATGIRAARGVGTARSGIALGLVAGYSGFLVASAFQNALWDRYIWVVPALILAATASSPARSPEPSAATIQSTARRVLPPSPPVTPQ